MEVDVFLIVVDKMEADVNIERGYLSSLELKWGSEMNHIGCLGKRNKIFGVTTV